ncbi:MAG: phosphate ABC transporter permease PstA [Kiritimatiellia bacterium]
MAPPKKSIPKGDTNVWITASMVGVTLLMVLAVVAVILVNGLGYFWPHRLQRLELRDGPPLFVRILETETREQTNAAVAARKHRFLGLETWAAKPVTGAYERIQVKIANRDLNGLDFRWIDRPEVAATTDPKDVFVVERLEYGEFYGTLRALKVPLLGPGPLEATPDALDTSLRAVRKELAARQDDRDEIGRLNDRALEARERIHELEYRRPDGFAARVGELEKEVEAFKRKAETLNHEDAGLRARLKANVAVFADAAGREKEIALTEIVRAYQPNRMGWFAKLGFYGSKIVELLADPPRESNTEGGIFPAIYGTVAMVLLMSLFCVPLGIIAALYLREYAKDGPVVRLVRIAVNNLAGVPSIVYGVFGLGFFVYGLGGFIDHSLYPWRQNEPVFGTGGLLWASLTLALLTVPVVIVATEEALSSIPKGMREGSLALGATKWQTIRGVLLPMASPGIMTGFILAVSRAAGEVAPLMITGVVKLAPKLPLDGDFPFLHFDRKFMHLGFHIYDVGFQSPNVEAARPMVFVTALLLLLIVILLNTFAIRLRSRMRKRYTLGAF